MSRASSATAPRVGQLTRQVTTERPRVRLTEQLARAPGRLPFVLDFALVPATALPPALDGAGLAVLGAGAGAAVLPLPPGGVSPPARAAASPVPRRVAVLCPGAVLPAVPVSCALRGPPADGVNCTPTSQVWPGCTVAPEQDSDSIAKSCAFAPPIVTPVTSSGSLPVFVRTDFTTSLVLSTSSLPNVASVSVVVIALKRSRPVRPWKPPALPPMTSARPSVSAVSVCCLRGAASVPAGSHVLASAS